MYGVGCKFEHRCALCGRFGHAAHNCRRARNLQNSPTGEGSHHGGGQGFKQRSDYDRNDRFHYSKRSRESKEENKAGSKDRA